MHRAWLALGALLVASQASAQQLAYTYGSPSSDIGTPNMATAQVSVGTTATPVAGARQGRKRVVFSLMAANDCYFGGAGVTTANGFRVKGVDGANLTVDTQVPVYAVCAAATTISVLELW